MNELYLCNFGKLQWYRRMITNSKLQIGQDVQAVIDDTINQYESVLNSNYIKQESKLIQELFEQVKEKKKELAVFKKMLSQENIDRLISERRREKEKERQGLESRWRECNESYKNLQEEQKRLINQHKENLFDAKKLQQKITQFQAVYTKLQEKVQNIQDEKQVKFMTQTHENYRSPYKREKTMDLNQTIYSQKMRKLNQSHTVFFSNKYSLNKDILATQLKYSDVLNHFSKTSNHPKVKTKTLNVNYPKIQQRNIEKENAKDQLFKFLLSPKVKQKIFDIINREL